MKKDTSKLTEEQIKAIKADKQKAVDSQQIVRK
jgi:hypothetical protein